MRAQAPAMTTPPHRPDIFDRTRRNLRRDRYTGVQGWFDSLIAEQLIERLDDVSRTFSRALIIGGRNTTLVTAIRTRCQQVDVVEPAAVLSERIGAITAEEDQLPVEPEGYDLVVWPGGLESVNDVPGALLRARWALQPDGLLVGCLFGDGSFPGLRRALLTADAPNAIARMHPQISLATLGDLLSRAGLALIVTDAERLSLSYGSIRSLAADMRQHALTNMLGGPVHTLNRSALARAEAAWLHHAVQGSDGKPRAEETLRLLHFSGWAPAPTQPQPARRGSAKVSLAQALKPPTDS